MSLQFQVEIARSKGLLVPADGITCPIHPSALDQDRNLTRTASTQRNQAGAVLLQQFLVHTRFVVKALQVGFG